jgi:selenocysteine lyase/cysteine desulfurase
MPTTRRSFLGAMSALSTAVVSPAAVSASIGGDDDPLGVRADFPVVQDTIFLDSAYTALSPQPALQAAQNFIAQKGIEPLSVGQMMGKSVMVRELFASLVGATVEEIGLLYATTDGENIVTQALNLKAGDNVLIDDLHYRSSYVLYQELQKTLGIEIRIIRNVAGAAPLDHFAREIDERTRLISVSWVSHLNGYRHDLKKLAAIAHNANAYLYVDAIQGIGMLDIDVKDSDVDFLTSGTYKWLLAGYGVAPFYVRSELLDMVKPDRQGGFQAAESLKDHRFRLHTDARKYQYATMAFDAVYHLGASLEYILNIGVPVIEKHTVGLAHRLGSELRSQGFTVMTPGGNQSAIVSFEHGGKAEMIQQALKSAGFKVTVSENASYVRIGIALFNNESEIDQLLQLTGTWV